ncbi:hypothetical protein AeMF1_006194 [Aphanomyces euteiches]|nr:hypothetical protein AeMF1_006194 [Aphanomyces euteiches]KAH9188817.1 hypothetical protein AeNC1_009207 [Aphanomyces euteiches]
MTDSTRPVWFTLVDKAMPQVQSGLMSVELSMPCTMNQFKLAVEKKCVSVVEGIKVEFMTIYPTINDDNTFSNPLLDDELIGNHGKSSKTALFVVILNLQTQIDQGTMSVKKPRLNGTWIPPLQDILYDQAEFDLGNLLNLEMNRDRLVSTPRLNAFFEDCRGFPLHYYVRTEEVLFWKSVKNAILDKKPKKAVLVGSPGVGKSCFLMLLGFYICAAIYLDGKNNKAWKRTNVSKFKLADLVDETCRHALLFVDGYTQNEVVMEHEGMLLRFHVLATSCEYDAKPSEESELIVLPAWRFEDLLDFARLTDWAVETGLAETKQSLSKLVQEQYYYSGGSLREFCKSRLDLIDRVFTSCRKLKDIPAHRLVHCHLSHRSGDPMDRLWRHYVSDRNNVLHYTHSDCWTTSVDSGFALKLLGQHVSADKLLDVYQFAKSIGAGFHGIAYKLYFHHAVRQAFHHAVRQATAINSVVVITMPDDSKYERIKIRPKSVDYQGQNESECYAYLKDKLTESTYWHPDYAFFPFIDAVAICDAYQRGHDEPEKLLHLFNSQQTTAKHSRWINGRNYVR